MSIESQRYDVNGIIEAYSEAAVLIPEYYPLYKDRKTEYIVNFDKGFIFSLTKRLIKIYIYTHRNCEVTFIEGWMTFFNRRLVAGSSLHNILG